MILNSPLVGRVVRMLAINYAEMLIGRLTNPNFPARLLNAVLVTDIDRGSRFASVRTRVSVRLL